MRNLLKFLLVVSLAAFVLDLFHMIFHLVQDPVLWQIPGVASKFAFKVLFVLIPFAFLLFRKTWWSWLLVFFAFAAASNPPAFAASSSECRHARELLDQAGMARDANEGFLGNIKRQPPYGSFPTDMDKITWWGVFKPYEFWGNPEFKAAWINPEGQEIASQKFRGLKCRLAKTAIYGPDQSRGEFAPGMWKVIITCGDYLIDRQTFAVLPASGRAVPQKGNESKTKLQPTAMIWAKDMLDDK